MTQFSDYTPKKIGNFNIPKSVIECKIDTLAILELMLRKNIASWEEIDEIREAVVLHLNVMFPELQLTYTTPPPLKEEAPFTAPEQPAKPLFYSAPPPEGANAPVDEGKPKAAAPPPLFQNVQPPKITSSVPRPGQPPVRPLGTVQPGPLNTPSKLGTKEEGAVEDNKPEEANIEQNQPAATEPPAAQPKPLPNAPKPMMPNAGPPKILNNPPRKNI
jgi:hypothetical protein